MKSHNNINTVSFIEYLQKNQDKLQKQFSSDSSKRENTVAQALFIPFEYDNSRAELPLSNETLNLILKKYTSTNPVPSKKEIESIYDIITEKGFSELFCLECCPIKIKANLSNVLANIFKNQRTALNDQSPNALLEAYSHVIWYNFEFFYFLRFAPDSLKAMHQNSMITPYYFNARFNYLSNKTKLPPAADEIMIISSAILTALCAIEAPLFLLLLLPIAGYGFYSRYRSGYYFFKPKNTLAPTSFNQSEKKPLLPCPHKS